MKLKKWKIWVKKSFGRTGSRTGIGDVLDVSQFRFQMGDAASVVDQRANHDDNQQNGDNQSGD